MVSPFFIRFFCHYIAYSFQFKACVAVVGKEGARDIAEPRAGE